ncbi:MAG: hypothetical protein ACE5EF_01130 [Dehalococcoidia bacterium]
MALRFTFVAALTAVIVSLVLLGFRSSTSTANAQGFPPPLPTTYFGTAGGASDGSLVTAYVTDGSKTTKCGTGQTVMDGNKVVYVIDVAQDGQTPGCGKAGRRVKLTFKSDADRVARPATATTAWVDLGPGFAGAEFDVVLGPAPEIKAYVTTPFVAKTK